MERPGWAVQREVANMSPNDVRKQKDQSQARSGLKHTLEEILEHLRDGLDKIGEGLNPSRPQPVPIPVPTRRPGIR